MTTADGSFEDAREKLSEHPMRLLFRYAARYRGRLAAATALALVMRVMLLVPDLVVASAVDRVITDRGDPGGDVLATLGVTPRTEVVGTAARLELLTQLALLAGASWVLLAATRWASRYLFQSTAQFIQHDLRNDTYAHVHRLSMDFYDDHQTGGVMAILNADVNRLEDFFNTEIRQIIRAVVMVGVIAAVMAYKAPELAAWVLAPVPVIGIATAKAMMWLEPKYQRIRETVARLNTRLSNNLGGIAVVKSFDRYDVEEARVEELSRDYRDEKVEAIKIRKGFFASMRLLVGASFVVVLLVGGRAVVRGTMTVGTFTLFFLLLRRLRSPVQRLGKTANKYKKAKSSAERVFGLLAHEPTVQPPADPIDPADPTDPADPVDPANPADPDGPADSVDPAAPAGPTDSGGSVDPADAMGPANPDDSVDPATPAAPADPANPASSVDPANPDDSVDPAEPSGARGLDGAVTMRNVTFSYDGGETVVDGVDLEVEPGETVGLAGPSGSGKSTLLKLLPRFRDPDEGVVRVDGVPVSAYDLRRLRDEVGVVEQSPYMFSGTIRENVAYGDRELFGELYRSGELSPEGERRVREAAAAAGAHEFVVDLPEGYDTQVGERGVKLSGGQRQRVSLARTLLNDPSIVVLDEATSDVDTRTEELIQANLSNLVADRTAFVIAHRLSTIRDADRIAVMDDGEVTETGTHDELVATDGTYAELWHRQVDGGPAPATADD